MSELKIPACHPVAFHYVREGLSEADAVRQYLLKCHQLIALLNC